MHIGDPEKLYRIDGFNKAYAESCKTKGLNHKNFIGPNDRFRFSCQRNNICCKNFSLADRIIIDPYDVLRLSRKLDISTAKFLDEYAELTLDDQTEFPIAILKYRTRNRRNKCHFLRSYGCSVYDDRPLRCRLYPLGRILHGETSYFIHIDNCFCEKTSQDRSWSVREWIEVSGAREYLDYQEILGQAYFSADWNAYRGLDRELKMNFARTIYDLDKLSCKMADTGVPSSDHDLMLALRNLIEDFFLENNCGKTVDKIPVACPF